MEWQWHQLDHIQIICTSLQTDNHGSTSSLYLYRPKFLFMTPIIITNGVKAQQSLSISSLQYSMFVFLPQIE